MIKTKKVKKLNKAEAEKIIKNESEEINKLGYNNCLSPWSFFKFLCTEKPKEGLFLTNKESIIYQERKQLQKNLGVTIVTLEEIGTEK